MTKIEKFISKLVPKERAIAAHLIERITLLDLKGLDMKKLTDMDGLYRVKKGDIRIKFYIIEKSGQIIDIDRKNDNTY